MQTLEMLEHLPEGSLEGGIKLLESFWWHIEIKYLNQQWFVYAGEQRLLETSSKESAEACVYGLALAYSLMPNEVLELLKKQTHP